MFVWMFVQAGDVA